MSLLRKGYLFAEMMLLFAATPVLLHEIVHGSRVPLIKVLPLVFLAIVLMLAMDREFSWARTLRRGISPRHAAEILVTFAVLGGAITLYGWHYETAFLSLPQHAPRLYLLLIVLYPLISVVTQEIVFRTFFFHRYREMLGGALTIALSAAFFGWSHIVMDGWVPVAISLAGGLLFAWRYHQTGSLWAVVFEHSLYGNLIFTAGLGRYFFTGVPNVG